MDQETAASKGAVLLALSPTLPPVAATTRNRPRAKAPARFSLCCVTYRHLEGFGYLIQYIRNGNPGRDGKYTRERIV